MEVEMLELEATAVVDVADGTDTSTATGDNTACTGCTAG